MQFKIFYFTKEIMHHGSVTPIAVAKASFITSPVNAKAIYHLRVKRTSHEFNLLVNKFSVEI